LSTADYVDLHTHTTASDGWLSPRALVHTAREQGLLAIGITDHDSTEGLDEALAAGRECGMVVIPGVEMSTDVSEGEVHVLGFFIDHRDSNLQTLLRTLREARRGRARRMVDKLAALGMPLDWERVQALAGQGAVGRPHVAMAMVERGYVPDVRTAFDLYINRTGPAYVERYKLTPAQAIEAIRQVGGLPVLAHPLEGKGCLHLVPDLVMAGLEGLECYYTGYTPEQTALLEATARQYDLVPSGGSDFHGAEVVAGAVLGQPRVPYGILEGLRARHGKIRAARRKQRVASSE